MLSFHLHLLLLASSLAQPCQADDPTSNHNGTVGFPNATKDIYGLGVRLGIYCQICAFLFGFLNLLRLDVKSLFAGVILAWTMLIRWFARAHDHDLSRAESWIAIALVLSFTVPGIWLLRFVFRAQRRKLAQDVGEHAARRQIVEGQGLNIMLTVISTLGVLAANTYFSFYLVGTEPVGQNDHGVTDKIWILAAHAPTNAWIRFALGLQAALSLCCAYPALKYAGLWLGSLWYWFYPSSDPPVEAHMTWQAALHQRFESWGLRRKWLYFLLACIFLGYSGFMIVSVEMTIIAAGLTPETDLLGPGQLIPLVTGIISLTSALADFARRRGPNEIAPWDVVGRGRGDVKDQVPLRRWKRESGSGSSEVWRESRSTVWSPVAVYARV